MIRDVFDLFFCWGPHLKLRQELPLHPVGFDLP